MFLSFGFAIITMTLGIQLITWIGGEQNETAGIFMGLFIIAYLLIGLIVLVDFLTLGALKKVKDNTFSRIYFWVYRFYSLVTLSFIFRPLLLNFIDNRFTRSLFFFSIPYTILH